MSANKVGSADDGELSRLAKRRRADRETRRGIHSVEVALQLIVALAEAGGPLSLKAVSGRAGLSAGKAHRYLASFTRCELAIQDPLSGLYDLGPLTLRLGYAAQNRIDAIQRALRGAERLARETGHTAMVTSWTDRGPVIVRWVQGSRPVYTTLSLGANLPLLNSATGRIYLAYLPERLTQRVLANEQRDLKSARARIASCKAGVIEAGYAEVGGDLIPGLIAVAAPVFDGGDSLVTALTLISSTSIGLTSRARLHLLKVAAAVSRELGWVSK